MMRIVERDLLDPPRQRGIGIITPLDFALDRELWRWVPEDVSLHVTRLPIGSRRFTLATAKALADHVAVERATRELLTPGPEVVAYTCAAGSFVYGAAGSCALRQAMIGAGAPAACTTAGALVDELRELGVSRLGIVTPYSGSLTRRLVGYLAEHGISTVTTAAGIGRRCEREDVEAVFICCTNVPTYDEAGPLAGALGKPVLTANEVLMRGALRALGRRPVNAEWRPEAEPASA